MQWPRVCPGLATHTLTGLCAQWLPSTGFNAEGLQNVVTNSEATCTAEHSPPVQSPPDLLTTAQDAFDLAVAQGMPRAAHSHTGGALCAVVAERRLLHH